MKNYDLVVVGGGPAGLAAAAKAYDLGVKNIIVCDSHGAINKMMLNSGNPVKAQIAEMFNPDDFEGSISEAIKGADVFVGVSAPDVLTSILETGFFNANSLITDSSLE